MKKAYVKVGNTLIPQEKATEEQFKRNTRVIVDKHGHVVREVTYHERVQYFKKQGIL